MPNIVIKKRIFNIENASSFMWYPIKTAFWTKKLFPNMLWSYPPSPKPSLYLTFDDGPIPEATPWVLEQLAAYKALATFFCIGRNVELNPDIYTQIRAAGHSVGNHTYNHLNGWQYNSVEYIENVAACARCVDSKLFRPPYGRLRPKQSRMLLQQQYRPVMWDVIAGDFDPKINGAQCLQNILRYSKNGSIIVLHDSKKAWPRLEYVLPRLLEHYSEKGFSFEKII